MPDSPTTQEQDKNKTAKKAKHKIAQVVACLSHIINDDATNPAVVTKQTEPNQIKPGTNTVGENKTKQTG